MSECNDSFFGYYQDDTATGGVLRYVKKDDTTVAARSNTLFAPAYSTLCIHISGTATVVIKNNPFADTSKDFTIKTVTATSQEVVTSAMSILVDVTAVTGTVTVKLIPNED
jgi:hypothetical protein